MIHHAIADKAGDHWRIQQPEAEALAKAASNVLRHYDLVASQKALDWGALITSLCAVYLPRVAVSLDMQQKLRQAA
jgi:hypothetical protein